MLADRVDTTYLYVSRAPPSWSQRIVEGKVGIEPTFNSFAGCGISNLPFPQLVVPGRIELPLHGYRPRALPLDEGTIVWHQCEYSKPIPEFWRLRCALRSLVCDFNGRLSALSRYLVAESGIEPLTGRL